MENKRFIWAAGLCLLVFLVWTKFFAKQQPLVGQQVIEKTIAASPQAIVTPQESLTPVEAEIPAASFIQLSRDNFDVVFIEPLAAVKEVIFKDHKPYTFPLGLGFFLAGNSLNFQKESQGADNIVFIAKDGNRKITKKFTFLKSLYAIDLEVKIENLSSAFLPADFSLYLGAQDFSAKNPDARFQGVVMAGTEKTQHITPSKDQEFSDLKFIALRDRYFCNILQPDNLKVKGVIKKEEGQKFKVFLVSEALQILPGQQIGQKFRVYLGPQELSLINKVNPQWSGVVNYGFFDLISQVLLQVLEFLHNILRNWGLAVIVLSILIYLVLFPLTLKQMRSMKEMQILQPKIEALRKLYKDNPAKMNKEVMEIYKEHKVNPLGGCLPLILQMPVFFALYNGLMRSVALRGAKFLWIQDLSSPDRLFVFPQSLPFIGSEFNILPIIMAIGMFFQQKSTMASSGGQAAEQQRIMLIMMPILFGFIFYHMPAGLVLYWLTNSILMMVFQARIKASK